MGYDEFGIDSWAKNKEEEKTRHCDLLCKELKESSMKREEKRIYCRLLAWFR
jgi:hypothetical protein